MEFNDCSALLLQRAIEAGITSPRELANIMGNADVETAGFSTMFERFNYKSAERVIAVVSSASRRFTREEIDQAVNSRDPRRIATILYENRSDLGNYQPGDGWRFRGRGYFQYTGRDNYDHWGRKFGVDLSGNPEQAGDPEMAAKLAIAYWKAKVPSEMRENIPAAAEIINGGENGMASRVAAARKWLHVISPQLVTDVQQGRAIYRASSRANGTASSPEIVVSAKNTATVSPKLQPGIVNLQSTLCSLGYQGATGRQLIVDGAIGPNTLHAIKSFQHAHHLHVDGIAGPRTLAALEEAKRYPLLSEATNPHHGLHRQVMDAIRALPQAQQPKGRELENTAVALTLSAVSSGLGRVDHVVLGREGVNLFAVQGRLDDPSQRRTCVALAHAARHDADHRAAMPHPAAEHVPAAAIGQHVAQRPQVMAGP
ncbi:MAG TPA: XVIPCD domain-containing protein [Luteimonas sp.]|nr:XVIPCD domain-containing protein [Luteimonas sp.]